MTSHAKLSELIDGSANDGNPATWTKMDDASQYVVIARAGTASPLDDVTIQLRKATDASGSNATNFGSAVTAAGFAAAVGLAADLGKTGGGLDYTHVSATVTDEASPNTVNSAAFKYDLRYRP